MTALEKLLDWFEQNPDREATVNSLSAELSMRPPTVHRWLSELHSQGILERRVGVVVRPNLSACKQFHFKATDRIAQKPKGAASQKCQSIVDRAIESRGHLLDAWWPIKAANQQQNREAA